MTNRLQWQRRLRVASLGLFVLLSVFVIAFGLLYIGVQSMLWFHAAAVPAAVRPQIRELYFALMHLIGGSSLGLGVLSLYTTLVPLRRGVPGAAECLVLALSIPFVIAGITAEILAATTGAPTAADNMIVLMTLTLLAYAGHRAQLWLKDPRSTAQARAMPAHGVIEQPIGGEKR